MSREVNEKRITKEALYMIKTKETVRELATVFHLSKSTIHKDLHDRLKSIDYNLYIEVDKILKYHAQIRHLRGGESTKQKYLKKQ